MSSLPPWNGVTLNLEPDDEDSNQYYDIMERPIWPKEGMACDVPNCSENKINNFTAYRRYWTKFHNEFIRKYKCDVCNKYSHVKRHMVTAHGHKVHGSPAVVTFMERNSHYRPPQGVLPRREDKLTNEAKAMRDATASVRRALAPEPLKLDNSAGNRKTVSRNQEAKVIDNKLYIVKNPIWYK